MLIYVISNSYPDKEYPYKQIFVYEQAKELAERGHKIVVLHVKLLPMKSILKKTSYSITLYDDGFANRYMVNQKSFLSKKLHAFNRFLFLRSALRLYHSAILNEGTPDVIYAHFSFWAGFAAAKISKKYHIPLVTIEHYGGLLGKISNTQKKSLKETILQSKFFLCVSDRLRDSLLEKVNCSNEIHVVPNMINREFHYVPPVVKDKYIFVSIGNLFRAKGFELLIHSFCKAFEPNMPVILRIGGDGPEKEHLQFLIKKNKREHQILLLGGLTREQTIQEYINCDCFVLASEHETFGMVYREALVTGRPIITTDHGGFSCNDWHDCYGYKIPVGDMDALVDSLISAYLTKRDGELISKICLNDCSAEKIGNIVEYYLEKATNN